MMISALKSERGEIRDSVPYASNEPEADWHMLWVAPIGK